MLLNNCYCLEVMRLCELLTLPLTITKLVCYLIIYIFLHCIVQRKYLRLSLTAAVHSMKSRVTMSTIYQAVLILKFLQKYKKKSLFIY